MSHTCSDCGKSKSKCRAVTKLVDGTILWVCPACWVALSYMR